MRRRAILDSAEALFVERGIAATSMEQVAQRAEVAKGTVYLYFSSKDDLVNALEERFTNGIVQHAHAAAEASHGAAAVGAWCVALANAYLDTVDVHDMLFYGRTLPDREVAASNPLIDDLRGFLETLEAATPELDASFLVGGVTLLVDRALIQGHADRSSVVGAVLANVRSWTRQMILEDS